MQYSQISVLCYECVECDSTPFQFILTETTEFDATDIATAVHDGCTDDLTYDGSDKDWLLDRECIEKYYSGSFDNGCFVCEFIPDGLDCIDDIDFRATKYEYHYFATLAGTGGACTVRIVGYLKAYYGTGATAEEACANLCHYQTTIVMFSSAGPEEDCCDYHEFVGPPEGTNTAWTWECTDCGGIGASCGAGLAIAPPPPPADPKYGSLEFIC